MSSIIHRGGSPRHTVAGNDTYSFAPSPLPVRKTTGKRGRPLWMRLAFLSLGFYFLLVVWFYRELSGMLSKHDEVEHQMPLPKIGKDALLRKGGGSSAAVEADATTTTNQKQVTEEAFTKKDDDETERQPSPNEGHGAVKEEQTTTSPAETTFFGFNRKAAEAHLQQHGPTKLRKTIGAYLEPPVQYAYPDSIQQGEIEEDEDPGMPPKFISPIPFRTFTPDDLKHHEYPKFQTCHDLPAKLPIDRGLEIDAETGEAIVWNVGNVETPDDYPEKEAPYCPVDADPFLPWIHDVFPNVDVTVMEFIAHNRRRCKTGRKHRKDVLRMEPQVALMQHVSVARIESNDKAKEMAPELWDDAQELHDNASRYRLASLEEAAEDGQGTRFICRFYGTKLSAGDEEPQSVLIDEVLSIYPFNYEFVSYRKGKATMLSPKGKDNKYFWTSVLRFQCPIPKQLQEIIRSGETILSDGTPTLHLDLIPIRTPPRFGIDEIHMTEAMIGPKKDWRADDWHNWRNGSSAPVTGFDAETRWGPKAILPRVEASGRWANLPICQTPSLPVDEAGDEAKKIVSPAISEEENRGTKKPHLLSACVWASASFKTRGKDKDPILDTGTRLREWIEFHLMVGFDHIYVFDNSGAQTNQTSLKPILDQYPKSQISRIEWPSIICNNNIPAHDSTGERSSQYTAENACRTRFAPFTEWIAAFDTDEYLVPSGNNTNLRSVMREAQEKGTNILTFRSSRARLLYEKSKDNDGGSYRVMSPNLTYMEAYNCDSSPIPKPEWADRARKQIYRADYVPYHYVHYSTVTKGLMRTYQDLKKGWRRMHGEHTERVTNELTEATMLHTKTTTPEQTSRWEKRCHYQFDKKWRGCYVGFAWPNGTQGPKNSHNEDGMEYNCFANENIGNYWVPKLKDALSKRHRLISEQTV